VIATEKTNNFSHRGYREHREKMGKEYSATIWPILYFEVDWPLKSYKFDLGVQLIKADKTLLEEITDVDSDYFMNSLDAAFNTRNNTKWFLAMRRPEVTEHIPTSVIDRGAFIDIQGPESEIGVSFIDSFQSAMVESFLMCLRLARSTAAICPFKFPAEIHEDSIVDVDTTADFHGINSDKPPVYSPEIFKIEDLQLSMYLWSVLVKLRRLDYWRELINKEEFFAACDKKAGEDAMKKLIDNIMSHPAYLEFSEEERKRHREQRTSEFKRAINKGDLEGFFMGWYKEIYKDSFQKGFLEKQGEVFSNRTRIGRALNLFFEGLHLPLQHSFLSMCLALETLYTVEDAEITYQFATRLANLTGKTFEQRKDIFERARKVYRERSNIVHGRKSIEAIESGSLKDAFFFARQSLQHILLNDTLMKLYSDPITSDKTKDPDKAIKAIKDYFRDLDLRCN
jgi:hypothetical protein